MQARRLFHARTPDAATKQHPPGGGHRKVTAALAATTAAGAMVLTAMPAMAALGHVGSGTEVSGVLSTGNAWLGAVEGTAEAEASGSLSWCIQAGLDAPSGSGATAVDYVSDPQLAWIVGTYESVDTELSRSAISYLMHTRQEEGTSSVSAATRIAAFEANTGDSVKAQASTYLAEAAAQAGPYTAADGSSEYTTAKRTGAITVHPLTSDAGTAQVGKPFTVTLNGPAVFDTNGNGVADADETNVYSGTTQATDIRLSWVGTGNGDVAWSISYGNVGRTTLTKYSASGQVQDTLTYGNRGASDPEEVTVPGPTFEVVMDFAVTGTSQVTAKVVDTGGQPGDTLHIQAADGDEWYAENGDYTDVPLIATAYDTGDLPVTSAGDIPADAVVLAQQQVVADGPGDYSVSLDAQTEGKGITWVWSTDKASMPDETRDLLREDWSDQYGLNAETTSVRHNTLDVASSVEVLDTKNGALVTEHAVVSGFPEGHDDFPGGNGFDAPNLTMTVRHLFFPAGEAVTDENIAAAQVVSEVEVTATNGYTDNLMSSAGSYHPRDEDGNSLPGTSVIQWVYTGDDYVMPYTSSVEDTYEQYTVSESDVVVPTVTTEVQSDRELVDGEQASIWDDVIVAGDITADNGYTTTVSFYHWTGETPTCTPATLVGTSDPITLTGPGRYTSSSIDLASVQAGQYGAQETLRNAAGQIVSQGACGAAAETLTVTSAATPASGAVAAADDNGRLATTGMAVGAFAGLGALTTAVGLGLRIAARRRALNAMDV